MNLVAEDLKRRNPGFDGNWHNNPEPEILPGRIDAVSLRSDRLSDLTPLGFTQGLRRLYLFSETEPSAGKPNLLEDLRPLARLINLRELVLQNTRVRNLAPISGLPLRSLFLDGCSVSDLGPLRDMPLERLDVHYAPLSDLTPLRGKKLRTLDLTATKVTDLTPLEGMSLENLGVPYNPVASLEPLRKVELTGSLNLHGTAVKDLSPLRGKSLKEIILLDLGPIDIEVLRDMPLENVLIDYDAAKHKAVLESLTQLKTINYKPVKEFWTGVGKP